MNKRLFFCAVLTIVFASALAADTVAIAVRERSEAEDAPLIADLIEQAAMEHLFQRGHIVFDVDLDPDDDVYLHRAITEAEIGGAATIIVIDVALDSSRGDVQAPGALTVSYLETGSERVLADFTLSANSIDRYLDIGVDVLAGRMGDAAAERALAGVGGGQGGW